MNLTFTAPSKTFLVGEYAVLAGGPALIINTEPRFSLTAVPGSGKVTGIADQSPAGRWLDQRSPIVEKWDIEFSDPHHGSGGFGASGAQFLFVHALTTFLQSSVGKATQGLNLKDIWNDHNVLSKGQGSGADLLAQALGGITLVNMVDVTGEAKAWPFVDLSFGIFRTGDKVSTHQHVGDLEREALRTLVAPSAACIESFVRGSSADFIVKIKEFSASLRNIKLQTTATLDLLNEIEKQPWSLAAKGCGALGADTILVLFKSENLSDARKFFADLGLPQIAGPAEISGGLDMKWRWDEN